MHYDEQREKLIENPDIKNHVFSDDILGIKIPDADNDIITLKFTAGEAHWCFFDKNDVIAMAKHFKLTADEL
jgi:hypothetical protein